MPIMTDEMRKVVQSHFPHILNHYVSNDVSDATNQYNCIAWAYGIKTHRLWPNSVLQGYVWPQGITNTVTLAAFIELFT